MKQSFFHFPPQKIKNEGISLALAFITSMLVLVLALYTLNSIARSFQRTIGIERSNKVFFAAESGIEAALFHKNSRPKGAHFDWKSWDDNNIDHDNWLRTTRLNHTNTVTEARWRLLTRFKPTDEDVSGSISPAERTYKGSLREYETIEIPLYYDKPTTDPQLPTKPRNFNSDLESKDIIISFPQGVPSNFNFGANGNIVNDNDPTGTDRKERLLVDWSLSRFHSTNGIQTFAPTANFGNPCWEDNTFGTKSNLLCETEIRDGGVSNPVLTLNSGTITGDRQPCLSASCPTNLQTFFSDPNSSQYRLRLQSLLPYDHVNNAGVIVAKIPEIPFTIQLPAKNPQHELPTNQYTVVSDVTQDDYSKEVSFTVNESSSIGAFNYVIFE